jgi:hypothetical protein
LWRGGWQGCPHSELNAGEGRLVAF